jgi:hypothetical protein
VIMSKNVSENKQPVLISITLFFFVDNVFGKLFCNVLTLILKFAQNSVF